jgi:hypothetical protein
MQARAYPHVPPHPYHSTAVLRHALHVQVLSSLAQLGTAFLHPRLAGRGRPVFPPPWGVQVCFGQQVRLGITTREEVSMMRTVNG